MNKQVQVSKHFLIQRWVRYNDLVGPIVFVEKTTHLDMGTSNPWTLIQWRWRKQEKWKQRFQQKRKNKGTTNPELKLLKVDFLSRWCSTFSAILIVLRAVKPTQTLLSSTLWERLTMNITEHRGFVY